MNIRPDRRQFIHAGLMAGSLLGTGCGGDPANLFINRETTILLYSPWSEAVRQAWDKAFSEWLVANGRPVFQIAWKPVPESGVVAAGQMARNSADGVLGGHFADHHEFQMLATTSDRLQPVRMPVVVQEDASGKAVPLPNKPLGWAAVDGMDTWAATGFGLDLGDPLAEPLSQVYSEAIWKSAPDAASAYARWVLLGRTRHLPLSPGRARLSFGAFVAGQVNLPVTGVWRGGNGLKSALGIDSGEAVHWPEALSLFASTDNFKIAQFMEFCRSTGKMRPPAPLDSASGLADSFRHELAWVVLYDVSADLSQTWKLLFKPRTSDVQVITQQMSAFHKRAEAYLAQRPPWPPASVTDLTKRRGFEYVVALIEQIAADGDQRDWLIREFQNEPQPVDPAMLDEALGGGLLKNVRLRAWLRAEWRAWVAQRCRRTRRLFEQGDFDTVPG